MLLDRLRPPKRRQRSKRLQNRLPGGSRVRRHTRRAKRRVPTRARELLRGGTGIANKRYDNHREHLYRYVVRRRSDLISTIIPFFRSYPMHSSKQRNFEKFALCVEMIDAGRHLSFDGLAEIVEIAETMNRQKPRTDLLRILRGHTPNVQDTG